MATFHPFCFRYNYPLVYKSQSESLSLFYLSISDSLCHCGLVLLRAPIWIVLCSQERKCLPARLSGSRLRLSTAKSQEPPVFARRFISRSPFQFLIKCVRSWIYFVWAFVYSVRNLIPRIFALFSRDFMFADHQISSCNWNCISLVSFRADDYRLLPACNRRSFVFCNWIRP